MTDILKNTARAQQARTLQAHGSRSNPRNHFINNIFTFIQNLQDKGNHIIFSWDANKTLLPDSDTEVERVLLECGLVDTHTELHPGLTTPATHSTRSAKLNFMFCSPEILDCIIACSIASFNLGYSSDHRALVVDFEALRLFGGITSPIDPTERRKLVSTNPRVTLQYVKHCRHAFGHNRIPERARALKESFNLNGASDTLIASY
jgi:hypothetical protein